MEGIQGYIPSNSKPTSQSLIWSPATKDCGQSTGESSLEAINNDLVGAYRAPGGTLVF
jgi:hypothetical protein